MNSFPAAEGNDAWNTDPQNYNFLLASGSDDDDPRTLADRGA
jgi:hypothetical protein